MKCGTTYGILWLLLIGRVTMASAQNQPLEVKFVKKQTVIKARHNIYFNSVKIVNRTPFNLTVYPMVNMPEGWKLARFMPIPVSKTIAAKDTVFIPVKIMIPKNTEGGQSYDIQFEVYNKAGILLGTAINHAKIPEIREWKMEVVKDDFVLLQDSSSIEVKVRLKNPGNVLETINLQYKIQDAIASQRIDLEPGVDSTLVFNTKYKNLYNFEEMRQEAVSITATNGLETQDKSVYFIKAKSSYNGYRAKQRPNRIGLVWDNVPNRNINTLGLRALGRLLFKNDHEFKYFILNNNLLNKRQLERSTLYRFKYLTEDIDLELGSGFNYGFRLHGIDLIAGRRPSLNGNNSLSMNWRPLNTDRHKTLIYVARNVRMPITSILASHRLQFNGASVEAAGAYALDFFGKKSTGIASLRSRFPIKQRHYIDFTVNGVNETHHLQSIGDNAINQFYNNSSVIFSNKSLNYNFYYSAYLWNGLDVSVNSSFASERYPSAQRGLFSFNTRVNYRAPKGRDAFMFAFRLQDKMPYTYVNGVALPAFAFKRKSSLLQYERPIGTSISLTGGALMDSYISERPSNFINGFSEFSSVSYKAFLRGTVNFGSNRLSLSTIQGYHFINDFMNTEGIFYTDIARIPSTNFTIDFRNRFLRLGANYLVGPNSLITDFRGDMAEYKAKRWRVFMGLEKYLFKRTVRLSSSFSGFYRQQEQQGSMSVTPRIDLYFKSGWNLYFSNISTLIFMREPTTNNWQWQTLPRFQAGIFRDFHVTFIDPRFDVDVICFKDDNGNGQMDAHERGLSDVQVKISPMIPKRKRSKKQRLRPVSLFSDRKGRLFFKKIVEGIHKINVLQVHNKNTNYIEAGEGDQEIEVRENMIVYIPFKKANRIHGKLMFSKAKLTTNQYSMENIRVTAISASGKTYHVLTDANGRFNIPVQDSKFYRVSVNNPFGNKVKVKQQTFKVNFSKSSNVKLTFEFKQRRRKVNFK